MSCSNPLKAWPTGNLTDKGKTEYKITSYKVNHIDVIDGKLISNCYPVRSSRAERTITDFVEIPCGKCDDCRLAYAKQWADRCMLEAQCHECNYFVTLTYDDAHLPLQTVESDFGDEFTHVGVLCKRDVQLFLKRLRKALDYPVRYFYCGEYGSETCRPHYHMIIYGLKLDDLVLYSKNFRGENLYNSEFLSLIWGNGHVVIGEVTWESCCYTARYILKKQVKKDDETTVLVPEFTGMSLKPGIGRPYYELHRDKLFAQDCVYLSGSKGAIPVRPPRYFERLYEVDVPESYADRKEVKRLVAENLSEIRETQTSVPRQEMLRIAGDAKSGQRKILKRRDFK